MADKREEKDAIISQTPSSSAIVEVKGDSSSTNSYEAKPQIHSKTFLAVSAICLIYFAQLITLVGAGAVSLP